MNRQDVVAAVVRDRAIEAVLHRYARSIDDREYDLLGSCFASDAEATYDGGPLLSGRAAIVDFIADATRDVTAMMHLVGNVTVDESSEGDADVRVHSYTAATLVLTGGPTGPVAIRRGVSYDDRFRNTSKGWLITQRVHQSRWMTVAPSVDPQVLLRPR